MSHAILRVGRNEFFVGFNKQGIPEWTDKKERAFPFNARSDAQEIIDALADNFRISDTLSVNLENKHL